MNTDGSSNRPLLRRAETGAVLVVVLLAMIALLGMGLTGLYLTSGSIQMSANINMRNQALYVAEAGIQAAKNLLNRTYSGLPGLPLNLSGMLAGTDPLGNPIALPSGFADEIPSNPGGDGCLGITGDGTPTRGAYLRDIAGFGCRSDTSAYVNCNYPASITRNQAMPDNSSPVLSQYMGTYTLFIRQDLAECRMGIDANLVNHFISEPQPWTAAGAVNGGSNGIVVIRSEGVASDNRTKVVLEVTMSPNPNAVPLPLGIASVCPAGAAGCDDNASVQQGITVSGSLAPPPPAPPPPPSGGTGGAGGVGGAGGTTGGAGGTSTTTPIGGSSSEGGAAGGATGGTTSTAGAGGSSSSCTKTSDCPSGQTCCSGACVDLLASTSNCGKCGHTCGATQICCVGLCEADPGCPSLATIGIFGPWDSGSRADAPYYGDRLMPIWLAQHTAGCGGKPLTIFNPSNPNDPTTLLTANRLAPYQVIILLDVTHTEQDRMDKINGITHAPCESYRYRGKGAPCYSGAMRAMQASEVTALANWVKGGGGLFTTVGLSNDIYEVAFPNAVLADSGIQYSTYYKAGTQDDMAVLSGTTVIEGEWGGGGKGLYGWKRNTASPTTLPEALTKGNLSVRVSSAFVVTPPTGTSDPYSYARGYGSCFDSGKPPPIQYFANRYVTIGVAGSMGAGRVIVWGDEWVTYDTVWGNLDNGKHYTPDPFWTNAIKWLGKCP